MMIHLLKIAPNYFQDIKNGNKDFEIRKNDRNYKIGDLLFLNEWQDGKYKNNFMFAKIKYLQTEHIKKKYVALGLEIFTEEDLKPQVKNKAFLVIVFVNNHSFVECVTSNREYAQMASERILNEYNDTNNLVSVRIDTVNYIN